ncbi:MAG: putative toxin-antitoxin system toxin component, PIN family [Bacteroidetes bacterium]|nr:putative toxin-antitoxin system toxin component, PIN family [Bacteroidota bacterium]MBU2584190.1 putative toxin-antitoxin system toxin component, PIN family [Bacteroidota bacterium]
MKVVVDSNIWISVLINKSYQSFIKGVIKKEIKIISSRDQLEEISRVITKPKISRHVQRQHIKEFLILFLKTVELVEIKERVNDCRDEKDNFILETALSGNVNYIITTDNDLLVMNPYREIKILTVTDFLKKLKVT